MQQCAEGWHRTDEPNGHAADDIDWDGTSEHDPRPDDPGDIDVTDTGGAGPKVDEAEVARRVRSTRRRQDAPDLPRRPVADRTIG